MKRATRYAFGLAALAGVAAVVAEFCAPLNCWARGRHDTRAELSAVGLIHRCRRCGRALDSVLTALDRLEEETVDMARRADQAERLHDPRRGSRVL